MPVSRPADERFGGMSSLDAIIERLREQACGPDEYRHWNYVEAVTLEQAEAAVRSAVDAARSETWDAAQAEMDAIRKEAGAAVDARTAEIVKLVEGYDAYADAVLRVVGDALMGDEAVQAAWGEIHGDAVVIHDTVVCALSAAWRVVTGSNA